MKLSIEQILIAALISFCFLAEASSVGMIKTILPKYFKSYPHIALYEI